MGWDSITTSGGFDPYAALRASQNQEVDAYGRPLQGSVDPSQYLDKNALERLGWTGGNGFDITRAAFRRIKLEACKTTRRLPTG